MIVGIDASAPGRVLVRDAATGRWLQFSHPREIVTAFTVADIVPGLERVENAVAQRGLYAAGFISYEAAPAFDLALTVKDSGGFPLLWFGLYDGAEPEDLPALAPGPDPGKTDWQASVGFTEFEGILKRIKRSEERRVGKEGRSRWSPYP